MKTRFLIIIGIVLASIVFGTYQSLMYQCATLPVFMETPRNPNLWNCLEIWENQPKQLTKVLDYSKLLKGADKNIDIAHHIDLVPINSTKHAFSIKEINLNSDDSITLNFGGVHHKFVTIPEFNYTQTFQVNDSFVFYCIPTESGYPSMGIYKYLGTHVIDGNLHYAFYHGDAISQNEFECLYPEIIEQSVNIFDIEVTPEMLQKYEIKLD